jgi:hypothetical protein
MRSLINGANGKSHQNTDSPQAIDRTKFREYGYRPDFCEAAEPESKGIVEKLVGYAQRDLMIPQAPFGDLAAANAAAAWCAEVNGVVHSEICAVPAERLVIERELLAPLPSLRAATAKLVTRKVDRLSCVRFGSARYSVSARLIGDQVGLRTDDGRLLVIMTAAGEVAAEHVLVAPGEASVRDEHYGGRCGRRPRRRRSFARSARSRRRSSPVPPQRTPTDPVPTGKTGGRCWRQPAWLQSPTNTR